MRFESAWVLNTRKQYVKARCHGLWYDDAWVREFWLHNFHRIDAYAFRSGQPSPRHLHYYIKHYGIQSVVNVRGLEPENAMQALEHYVCKQLGVKFYILKLHSRDLPRKEVLHEVYTLLKHLDYPAWFHCKSGADRAGLMATLYLHWVRSIPIDKTHQLRFWPYFHYRYAKTGRLDHFFAAYLEDNQHNPQSLLEWIDNTYDRDVLRQSFKSRRLGNILTDILLKRE